MTDSKLESALNHAMVRERLASSGIKAGDVDTLLKDIDVQTSRWTKPAKK